MNKLTALWRSLRGQDARSSPTRLSPIKPLNWRMAPELAHKPAVNILLPWLEAGMTGGPNTGVNLGCQIAARGIPVRFVSCDKNLPDDCTPIWNYIATLGGKGRPAGMELTTADDRDTAIEFGRNDQFVATYFHTAHYINEMASARGDTAFFYLIQDFEPAFFEWSSSYALALESYGWNFRALINERFLADYLFDQKAGRFADAAFRDRCVVFEPALDRRFFHPRQSAPRSAPRRLLFYARPFAGRNLFELGHDAIDLALQDPVFAGEAWDIVAIGGQGHVADMPLAGGRTMKAGPWRDYAGYAEDLRNADILLSLMLSPHTSYPVLEMAACGGLSVTNAFATKTQAGLQAISPNILAVEPTVPSLAAGLIKAARMVAEGYDRQAPIHLPQAWDESLREAVDAVEVAYRGSVDASRNMPAVA